MMKASQRPFWFWYRQINSKILSSNFFDIFCSLEYPPSDCPTSLLSYLHGCHQAPHKFLNYSQFMVITLFDYIWVRFTTIIFDVIPRSNVLLDYWKQQTLFPFLHNHHKQILIDLNFSKNPWTITNWMVAMILTLREFWFIYLELYARSSSKLLLSVNVIDDDL